MKYQLSTGNRSFLAHHFIYLVLLIVVFLGFYFKPLFLDYQPEFSKNFTDLRIYKQMLAQHSDPVIWQENILAGSPVYGLKGIEARIFNTLDRTSKIPYSLVLIHLLWGGIGVYILFIFFDFPRIMALLVGIVFSLSSYYFSFYLSGRADILKFIGFLPWVIFLFLYLKNRRSFLAAGLLTLALILTIKDPVPGLIAGLLTVIFISWIIFLIVSLLKREFKYYFVFTVLLLLSLITAFISIAYPGYYLIELNNVIYGNLGSITTLSVIFIFGNLLFIILWGVLLKYGIDNIDNEDSKYYQLSRILILGLLTLLIILLIMRFFFDQLFITYNLLYHLITFIITLVFVQFYNTRKVKPIPISILFFLLIMVFLFLNGISQLAGLQRGIEENFLPESSIADEFFARDNEIFRIYPLGNEFNNISWGFYNQTIGGNFDYRLKRYQLVMEECLNTELQNRVPINWNILDMLNVKYLFYKDKIDVDNLKYSFYDLEKKLIIYQNINYLPRAWFVNDIEYIESEADILKRLNSGDFTPSLTAIVESSLSGISQPVNYAVKIDSIGQEYMRLTTKNDSSSFLVISEIYCPINSNWKAYLDGSEIPIYPANYVLRGLVIPSGEHEVILHYKLKELPLLLKFNLLSLILTLIFILIGFFHYVRKNYKGEIVYVIKK